MYMWRHTCTCKGISLHVWACVVMCYSDNAKLVAIVINGMAGNKLIKQCQSINN